MKKDFITGLKEGASIGYTENGAKVYTTSMDNVVDLFSRIGNRKNVDMDRLSILFKQAYAQDKELTLKMLFYARDCREGLGVRNSFRKLYESLSDIDINTAIYNIQHMAEYGRYDDLIDIAYHTKHRELKETILNRVVSDFVEQSKSGKYTLLWKWLPSINTSSLETRNKAKMIIKYMRPQYSDMKNRNEKDYIDFINYYRRELKKGRDYIKIVEKSLTEQRYEDIDYSHVPSLAMLKYKNNFLTKDTKRFKDYIESVKTGKSKINASVTTPYDVVHKYFENYIKHDETLEQIWKNLPNYFDNNEHNIMCVVDVSGSMNGTPIEVAISLGLYCAEHNKGQWHNKMVTFSHHPNFIEVSDNMSLRDKISKTMRADWDMNTNIEAVFDLILNTAVVNEIPNEELPKQIIIISDMQFDSATIENKKILFKHIKDDFNKHGYSLPKLVFWNVRDANNIYPMKKDEHGICYVSGYSPVLFKTIIDGEFIEPIDIIRKAVNVTRYDKIEVVY